MSEKRVSAVESGLEVRINALREAHAHLVDGRRDLTVAYAPGRAEILGSHTDYNDGFTISASVRKANLLVAASRRSDRQVRVRSLNMKGPSAEFDISSSDLLVGQKSEPTTPTAWSNYVKGVLWAMASQGHELTGFDAVIDSTIPAGGGLSSSAALETAFARLVCHFNDLPISPYEQVELCKQAENEYVGAPCGYLDQATVGLASDWLFMSYRPVEGQPFTYEPIEVDIAAIGKLLVVGYDPKSKHALVDGKYALRQQACFGSLSYLRQLLGRNVTALRDVSVGELEENRKRLIALIGAQATNFVTHVVYENRRVLEAKETLRLGDTKRLGELITESGSSAINLYELAEDSPELGFVYDNVTTHSSSLGVLGIRNMGGGFNATTLALVEAGALADYQDFVNREYRRQFGRPYSFISFVPAPAASIIEESGRTGSERNGE